MAPVTSASDRMFQDRVSVPSFRFTSDESRWEDEIFPCLLMRHGPPPRGVKFYGTQGRIYFSDRASRLWVGDIIADCQLAIQGTGFMSHCTDISRERKARQIKNRFIEWLRDESTTENKGAAD
jgi:hypothetical protein